MLSEAFARCIAHLCGDGNIGRHYLRYNNTSDALLSEFKEDMESVFGSISFTTGTVNSGTRFVQTGRKEIRLAFLDGLSSYKSAEIRIPRSILAGSLPIKSAFIHAFYDDEGSPSLRLNKKTKEWKRNIHLTSKSRFILEQIKQILDADFNISANVIIPDRKEEKVWFVLSITGKKNFENFAKKIGFSHPIKKERLSLMLESYGKTYSRNRIGFKNLRKKCSHSLSLDSDHGFPRISAVHP